MSNRPPFLSEAARECGVQPAVLSRLFYNGELGGDECPIVSGRRLIDREYLEAVVKPLLRRRGYAIPQEESCAG